MALRTINFQVQHRGAKAVIVTEKGVQREATPEEVRLWANIQHRASREDELLKFIDKHAGGECGDTSKGVDGMSILGWYVYLRLGDVNIKTVDPIWLNGVIRDFKKMKLPEVVKLLRQEFPEDFKVPKGMLCAVQ